MYIYIYLHTHINLFMFTYIDPQSTMATNPSTVYHLKAYLSFLGNEDLALVFQSLHFLRRYAALVHRGLQYLGCDGDLGPATRW